MGNLYALRGEPDQALLLRETMDKLKDRLGSIPAKSPSDRFNEELP